MIRGDQLAAALGGYDRWLSFRKVTERPVVKDARAESEISGSPTGGTAGAGYVD
jgi:hypothetical protein